MTLTLLAVSLNEQPLSQPITAHFDGRGGSIGRADHNTMALPDPERQISRLQAEIVASGNGFLIRNLGAANPIVVSGRWLSQNESAPLAHGDEIRIGGYLLHVDGTVQPQAIQVTRGRAMISAAQPAPAVASAPSAAPYPASADPFADLLSPSPPAKSAPSSPPPAPAPASPVGSVGNPFADLLGGGAAPPPSADPFADLLAPAPRAQPSYSAAPVAPAPSAPIDPFADLLPPPAGVQAGSAGLAPKPQAAAPLLPDDFDPFAAPPPPSFSATPSAPVDPFAGLVSAPPPASINAMFGLDDGTLSDPLANFMAAAPAPAASGGARSGVPTDPLLAMFNDTPPPPPSPVASEMARASPLNAAFAPPRALPAGVVVPAPAAAPAVTPAPQETLFAAMRAPAAAPAAAPAVAPAMAAPVAARAPVAGGDVDRLWAAFCEGAGISMSLPPGAAEQRFREIGQILQSAVSGTLGLMAVRASTRHELRAAVTVIQARDNNPLKFSPDSRAALDYLLQPAVRGFLEGSAAMEDAMHDLVGHSIGTVAGMRAALEGMLDRFSPEELEAKLVGKSMLDTLLPGSRKARLWDLYLQHHGTIREDAQENFHAVFGKAFLAAYEQQIDQLKSKRKG